MFRKASLYCAVIAGALAVAACSRKAALDDAAPLAYVPTDTPYVFANREPLPEAAMARWRAQMAQAWPLLLPIFDQTATQLAGEAPQASRWIKAILDEVRQRTTPEQWREIGLDSKLRSAFYGVGALPVLRVELADAAAFKAAFERIEKASGSTLATTQMGTQEVRTITAGDAIILLAIEPHHFVLAAVPADANDMVKQLVLGLERPNQSLADSDALAAFERSKGYLPYGSGWLDSKRLLALIDMPKGGGTLSPEQATCNAEREAIAAKLPRLALGYTRLDATRMDVHMRLELEPTLAKALAALGSGMPGAPAADALLDFGIAVPVLKARDFLVAQAEAVAKAPFQCKELVGLNESFAEARSSLDRTIPPPFADLTGLRLVLDQFTMPTDFKAELPTDLSGSLLVGSNSPAFLVGLAQMSAPPLQNLRLNPDGKPVALPTDALGSAAAKFDVQAAMGPKALGIAIGPQAIAGLSSAVMQAPASDGVVLSTAINGRLYGMLGDLFANPGLMAVLPAEQQATLEAQRRLYALYAQWFKRIEMRLAFVPEGVDFSESVEMLPAGSGTPSVAD